MDEEQGFFDNNELTHEDLEALAAFDALEAKEGKLPVNPMPSTEMPQVSTYLDADQEIADMLQLFVVEADEEITTMQQAVHQLEQDENLKSPSMNALKRAAHKLKGSAGTVGCNNMATIAIHTEALVNLMQAGTLSYLTGVIILAHAVRALEATMEGININGQEKYAPLTEFEEECGLLSIDLQHQTARRTTPLPPLTAPEIAENLSQSTSGPLQDLSSILPGASTPGMRVDSRRMEDLTLHAEHLTEQRASLESAQVRVTAAMEELNAAQNRLQRLEMLLSTISMGQLQNSSQPENQRLAEERPTSSLIARILDEASQRTGRIRQRRNRPHLQPIQSQSNELWDDMEIDRYTESDVLAISLNEAVADVALASSHLRIAFSQLNQALQKHIEQANLVQSDVLKLRSAPFNTLLPRLQQTIQQNTRGWKLPPQIEVLGDTTEIEQDILDDLSQVLITLLQSCLSNLAPAPRALQVKVQILTQGNELTVDVDFSQPVQSGSLDIIYVVMQRLKGIFLPQQHPSGNGIRFSLRIPRARGTIKGLLAGIEDQQVIIPLSQIQQVSRWQLGQPDADYKLNALLGFVRKSPSSGIIPHILTLDNATHTNIEIEETYGEVELLMKPLDIYLQRPGLLGTALDGTGRVFLVVDLFDLIQHSQRYSSGPLKISDEADEHPLLQSEQHPKILIADDSVSIRQSLQQALQKTGFEVREARDGLEALEILLENQIDLVLLDIEMPNLNGYDLLSILHIYPQLANLKTIMLSSRSSEKHQQRARDLGVQAYLIKPTPRDILLSTVQSVLYQKQANEA
ncbi:MAG TPA: response regulator [Ktedonobacteraceae bacterium]|nr:response regulator [Ktedonobacteraceae bacterium]